MNKLILISTLVMAALLTSLAAFAYTTLPQSQFFQEDKPIPDTDCIPNAHSNSNLTPSTTPTPTPSAEPTYDPTKAGSFGPLGCFYVTSPTDKTYNTKNLTLNISGSAILASNVNIAISYSLDGQTAVPISTQLRQMHDWDPIGGFTSTVTLPPLTSGSHTITVNGNLEADGDHIAQVIINFTIQ